MKLNRSSSSSSLKNKKKQQQQNQESTVVAKTLGDTVDLLLEQLSPVDQGVVSFINDTHFESLITSSFAELLPHASHYLAREMSRRMCVLSITGGSHGKIGMGHMHSPLTAPC